jgi:glycosyltransferase involved in cell wall biosynthesis
MGIPVEFVGASSFRLGRLFAVCKAVKRFRPGVVQSQHFFVNAYAALAARLCGALSIGAVRNDGLSDMSDCGRIFGELCLRLPEKLAVNSQAAIQNLAAVGCRREKLLHLPNVIDTARFRPSESSDGEGPVILGIGRLVPQKRFDLFLAVIARLRPGFNVHAIIAGDGPLRDALRAQATHLGLFPSKVEFLGQVSNIEALYRRASLLLLTSDHEGTPNVVLEAMASGLPVISTRVGDVPALLGEGERGRLVERGDLPGLVATTEELIVNIALRSRLAEQARGHVEQLHSPEAMRSHLANLYALTSI